MINRALFSSASGDWGTPDELFRELDKEFHFTFDAAATHKNAKCTAFLTPEDDAFQWTWPGRVWLNPPYGRDVARWLKKACIEVQSGHAQVVVVLLPARTDTRWFHEHVLNCAEEIRFIRGRLRFEGATNSAPFPSMLAVYRK